MIMRLRRTVLTVIVGLLLASIAEPQQNQIGRGDRELLLRKYRQQLSDTDRKSRWYAAIQIGRLGDATCLPVLREIFNDADVGTRHLAAQALGKINDRDAVFALLQETSIGLQGRIVGPLLVSQLAKFNARREALDVMRSLLKSEDWAIAVAAARAMDEFASVDMIAELKPLILDGDLAVQVRAELIRAMREATLRRLKSVYAEIAGHAEDELVRRAVVAQMSAVGELNTGPNVGSVERVHKRKHPPLTSKERETAWSVLGDPNRPRSERLQALRQFGLRKDLDSVDRLIDLCEKSADVELKGSVLITLAQIGDRRAIPLAKRLSTSADHFVVEMAGLALRKLSNGKTPVE